MIRILHFTTDSKISGTEKLLIGIAKNYDRQKFKMYFCTLKKRGQLHQELENLGQDTFSLDCANIYSVFTAAIKLNKILKDHKIDILHTHLYHASIIGQIVAKFKRGVISVMTRHYSDLLYIYGNRIQRFLDRRTLALSRHIIAISNCVSNVLVNQDRVCPKKITVIYNGIDTDEFNLLREDEVLRFRRELGISDDKKIIGSVGSLHPRKGHIYFLKAAKLVCQKRSDVVFLLVGEGYLERQLVNMRGNLGLEDKFFFLGYRNDTAKIMLALDIYVHPSVEEGFGISIIEAMALGKPVIATNVGGIPEIIQDRNSGLLVSSKDHVALSNAIEYLLDRPELCGIIGNNAKIVVREKFDLKSMVRDYEKLYDDILKQ